MSRVPRWEARSESTPAMARWVASGPGGLVPLRAGAGRRSRPSSSDTSTRVQEDSASSQPSTMYAPATASTSSEETTRRSRMRSSPDASSRRTGCLPTSSGVRANQSLPSSPARPVRSRPRRLSEQPHRDSRPLGVLSGFSFAAVPELLKQISREINFGRRCSGLTRRRRPRTTHHRHARVEGATSGSPSPHRYLPVDSRGRLCNRGE